MNTDVATFLSFYEREHATTARVLRALPEEAADLKPSAKSKTAKELAFICVSEERMILLALRGEDIMGSPFPTPPATLRETADAFDAQHKEVLAVLRGESDDVMRRRVAFPVAPRQMGEYSASEFLWFMMFDQIHHRGQLSVYLRIAGAKVPSIYGPTADEPWT